VCVGDTSYYKWNDILETDAKSMRLWLLALHNTHWIADALWCDIVSIKLCVRKFMLDAALLVLDYCTIFSVIYQLTLSQLMPTNMRNWSRISENMCCNGFFFPVENAAVYEYSLLCCHSESLVLPSVSMNGLKQRFVSALVVCTALVSSA